MFKQEKGITLVALVITIIVLLILAGVSISLVMGDNGVLSQANNAVNSTELASVKDEISMAMTTVQTNYYATYGNTTGRSTIKDELTSTTKLKKEFPNAAKVVVKITTEAQANTPGAAELYYTMKGTGGNTYKATLVPTLESVSVSSVELFTGTVPTGTGVVQIAP
jgi:hypothetical protein